MRQLTLLGMAAVPREGPGDLAGFVEFQELLNTDLVPCRLPSIPTPLYLAEVAGQSSSDILISSSLFW